MWKYFMLSDKSNDEIMSSIEQQWSDYKKFIELSFYERQKGTDWSVIFSFR